MAFGFRVDVPTLAPPKEWLRLGVAWGYEPPPLASLKESRLPLSS